MSDVTVTVKAKAIDTTFGATITDYGRVYGTGAYSAAVIVDDGEQFIEHCLAGESEFVKVDDMATNEISVHVITGSKQKIANLVKKEVEHFGEEVELIIV